MSAASPHSLADACIRSLLAGNDSWTAPAEQLAALAASEAGDSAPASTALFRDVVEPLADRFAPAAADAYALFFSRVLERVLPSPGFEAMRRALEAQGLATASDFRARRDRIKTVERRSAPESAVQVVVLSRVTVGADVAVNAPLIRGCLERFPEAEILFAGDVRAASLFRGSPRVRHLNADYPRRGALRSRFDAWRRLSDALPPHSPGRVILDADTRWTQSGLLPLGDEPSYFFFESRSYRPDSEEPLGKLAADWLAETFDVSPRPPQLFLASEDLESGLEFRRRDERPLAVVNFGVGGNESKRVRTPFEPKALRILAARGFRIALDQGWGEEEAARSGALAEAVGASSVELWQGEIGALAGLISAADLYVGYDSAGAHLAAAAGTRAVDIFAGAVNERMRKRWTPYGAGRVDVITVAPDEEASAVIKRFEDALG